MTETAVEIPGYVAGTWTIDPVHSEVSFVVRHMMVSKVRGRFDKFEGTIVTAEDPLQSSVNATVDLSSVNTGEPNRDNHIRSADFFEVESHPTLTFHSTGVRPDGDNFLLDGDLTIRGTTRPVTLKLEVNGFGPDAYGGTRAGFSATGEINRNDFGVSYNGPIPGGGVAVSEKVTITLVVVGVLNKGEYGPASVGRRTPWVGLRPTLTIRPARASRPVPAHPPAPPFSWAERSVLRAPVQPSAPCLAR